MQTKIRNFIGLCKDLTELGIHIGKSKRYSKASDKF